MESGSDQKREGIQRAGVKSRLRHAISLFQKAPSPNGMRLHSGLALLETSRLEANSFSFFHGSAKGLSCLAKGRRKQSWD